MGIDGDGDSDALNNKAEYRSSKWRFLLGIRTAKQSSIPCLDKTLMWGLTKVDFFYLLSGMAVIGWTMESGRRG
ncbi:hypothetical protein TNCV_3171421 [Trichonephila clavipes]|nr:hypothetical protein TNCV_3171421 [Trichonephila clavipes]